MKVVKTYQVSFEGVPGGGTVYSGVGKNWWKVMKIGMQQWHRKCCAASVQ
jgi:hypothetical protein